MASPPGKLVVTFDLELAWGSVENEMWRRLENDRVFARTREAVRSLLGVMDALEIPATWAVVGALCDSYNDYDMSHVPDGLHRPIEALIRGAQVTSLDGRDLVASISNAAAGHYLACHSYAHLRYRHPLVNEQFVADDLRIFAARRPKVGNWSSAIIFPCNEDGYWNTVYQAGYRWCRATAHPPFQQGGWRRWTDRVWRMATAPPLSTCSSVGPGINRCTDSMLFNTGRRTWMVPWVMRRARRGLQRAVRESGVFHVWTHPFNFAETPALLQSFQALLLEAARLRDAGRLVILPFGVDLPPNYVA